MSVPWSASWLLVVCVGNRRWGERQQRRRATCVRAHACMHAAVRRRCVRCCLAQHARMCGAQGAGKQQQQREPRRHACMAIWGMHAHVVCGACGQAASNVCSSSSRGGACGGECVCVEWACLWERGRSNKALSRPRRPHLIRVSCDADITSMARKSGKSHALVVNAAVKQQVLSMACTGELVRRAQQPRPPFAVQQQRPWIQPDCCQARDFFWTDGGGHTLCLLLFTTPNIRVTFCCHHPTT